MINYGAAWYPEHWPEERWTRDLELMAEAGFTVIRVGEFAWSAFEPADGQFETEWMHKAIDKASEYDLKIVMCTPTPAPPSWLTRKHPDILPVRNFLNGTIQAHGKRGHYDPTNATYQDYCRRITLELGQAFGHHPNVIGWQTDNEFWTIAQNPSALSNFRDWCIKRYGSMEQLNEAWSTGYWSQTYFSPEDLLPPTEPSNPGLYLAWYRWASDATAAFQSVQIKALRETIDSRQWITHNFHPYDDQDRSVIAKELDVTGWDAYIYRPEMIRLDPAFSGRDAARIRDLNAKNRPFWIWEMAPGFVNWRDVNRHLDPGETRSMAWHLVGHGADAVLYWQWRSAPGGQEQYHGCLLQQNGEPRPVYEEVAQLGQELKQHGHLFNNTRAVKEVALIDRWCDRMALGRQPHHKSYDPKLEPVKWFRAVHQQGLGLSVLEELSEIPTQPILMAPQLHLMDEQLGDLLIKYVEQGGHLIIGPRFSMKNAENALWPELQPGPLQDIIGAVVEEYYALHEPIGIAGTYHGEASLFAERWSLNADDIQVVARFDQAHPWLVDRPAIFTRNYGNGQVTVCAACMSEQVLGELIQWATETAGLNSAWKQHNNVEVIRRCDDATEEEVVLAVNHSTEPQLLQVPFKVYDYLSETSIESEMELKPFGVALMKRDTETKS